MCSRGGGARSGAVLLHIVVGGHDAAMPAWRRPKPLSAGPGGGGGGVAAQARKNDGDTLTFIAGGTRPSSNHRSNLS